MVMEIKGKTIHFIGIGGIGMSAIPIKDTTKLPIVFGELLKEHLKDL